MGLVDALYTVQNQPSQAASIQALQQSDVSAETRSVDRHHGGPQRRRIQYGGTGVGIHIATPAGAITANGAFRRNEMRTADDDSSVLGKEEDELAYGLEEAVSTLSIDRLTTN